MIEASLPQPLIRGQARSTPICSLFMGTPLVCTVPAERQLLRLVLPPWQRPAVWSEQQQISFIEGIFLGLGAGVYVVNGSDFHQDGGEKYMSGWLIDGQQRITAIARFIQGEIAVFNGIRYQDLSQAQRFIRFDNVVFNRYELDYQGDEQVLKDIYRRLNFGGTPQTNDDLLRLDESASEPLIAGLAR